MNIKENKFKYLMIFFGTLLFVIIIMMIAGDKKGGKSASISNGVDIAVMPTKETDDTSESNENSSMQAVIIDIDTKNFTMILQEVGADSNITYTYTGGTDVVNRYDDIMSVSQLNIGEVVEVQFAANRKLSKIKISDADWEYKGVTNFTIDTEKKLVIIGSEKYSYTDSTVVINSDRETEMDKLDSIDVLTLKGRDKQLDSIIVTTGHGYVRLDSTTYFEGGFIEIGSKIVQLITENMVIPVPAGEYTMTVTKDKTSGSKDISVGVNEEIRVNLTEFQSDAVRLGTLSFKITPSGAKLMIDGVAKDYSQLVDVAYGTHKVVITADGYEPYSQVINVQEIFKEYDITLTEAAETSAAETNKETETTKKSSTTETTTRETQTTTSQTIDYAGLIGSLFGD